MKKKIVTYIFISLSIFCIWTLMSSSKKETIEEPKIYNKIANPELVMCIEDLSKEKVSTEI